MAEPVIKLYAYGRYAKPNYYNGFPTWRFAYLWVRHCGVVVEELPQKYRGLERCGTTIWNVGGKVVSLESRDSINVNYPEKFDLVLKTQYCPDQSRVDHDGYPNNVTPFIVWTDLFENNFDKIPHKPKFSFHCSLWSPRRKKHELTKQIVDLMNSRTDVVYSRVPKTLAARRGAFNDYITSMKRANFAVVAPGSGDMTGRDVDAMAARVPFFRLNYCVQMYNKLKSGEHYWGLENFEAIKKFVEEVPDRLQEKEFRDKCDYMKNRAREWYEQNATVKASFELFKKICSERL